MRNPIDQVKKLEYLEEMIQPYEKKNEKKYFIEQFLHGAGNELDEKFWELRSSSRMAYDLYSWMKDERNVIDFAFEYQLPGLKSGGNGPNMDIFIETKDELIFIESKFTEKANLHYIDNHYLREAYHEKGDYGRKNMPLFERFDGNTWATKFSDFCEKWEKEMNKENWHKGRDWFEPKQETCHLSGILLFLFKDENQQIIKNKKIRLYNIYWKMDGDENSAMKQRFCELAQKLINDIITEDNRGIQDFKIDAFSVQEMLENQERLSPHIKFPENHSKEIFIRNKEILEKEGIKRR